MKCAQNISSKILCPKNKNNKAHKGSYKAVKQYK